jgi:acetyltransferase
LMQLMIAYARSEGIQTIKGQVLRENTMMLEMCRELGFRIEFDPQEPTSVIVTLQLSA